MMQKNDLIIWKGSLHRILEMQDNNVLLINCVKRTMPIWYSLLEVSQDAVLANPQDLQKKTGVFLGCFKEASIQRQNEAHRRFSLIAGLTSVINEKKTFTKLLTDISVRDGVSKQTLRRYLCDYLVFQDLSCLLPADKAKENK